MYIQFSPILFLYLIATLITAFAAYHTWKTRDSLGASSWGFVMFFASFSAFTTGLEILLKDPTWKFAMIPFLYFGSTGLVFFWGIFCIIYSNYQHWLNKYTITLLALPPLMTFILSIFVGQHNLIYESYEFVERNGLILGQVVEYGWYFWFWASYAYIILAGGAILLIQAIIRFPNLYQGQVRMLVLAISIPILVNILYVLGYTPFKDFDISPLAGAVSGIIMFFAMKRYHFLDIVPIAHDVIFDNVISSVLIIDLQGRIINLNTSAENVFQCERNKVIGMHADVAFPEFPDLQRYIDGDTNTKTEIIMQENIFELRVTPLLNRRQKLVGHVIMLYNITERKQVEQKEIELAVERERVEILQEFISNASHDLKTPLATMKTYHFLLRRELGDNARLDTLDAQTARLSELIDDMLMMVRLEGYDTPELNAVDIVSLIHAEIDELASSSTPQIQFISDSEPIIVQANEEELALVLSHLLNNAIRNTPTDGKITIHTNHQEDTIQITVKDTGVGISETDLPRIFERFYRVDKARNTQSGGTGLGLAIVKRIVERHHGTISVSSTVGEGTGFRITLPLSELKKE